MMKTRRNRKKFSREAAIPSPFFMLLGAGIIIAFVYLWLDQRCESLGRRIAQLEGQKVELQRQVKQESARWERAKAPEQVNKLLQRHHVVMTWPDERSIVRIRRAADEPSATETATPRHQFAHAGGIAND